MCLADEIVEAFVESGAAEHVTLIELDMGRKPDLRIFVEYGETEKPVDLGLKRERLVGFLKREGAEAIPEIARRIFEAADLEYDEFTANRTVTWFPKGR